MPKFRYFGLLFFVLLISAIVYRMFFFAPPQMPSMMPPEGTAMPAVVSNVIEKEVDIWKEFSGTLAASEIVQIMPLVNGQIRQVLFKEGSSVQKADPLFIIDQRRYIAEVQRNQANVAAAKTQAEFAASEFERAKPLLEQSVITQSKFDERLSAKQTADANLKSAEASLASAQLNLDYSTVKAPISGKISRAEITTGNLVDPMAATILATIVSLDPIYAEFNIDEQSYLKIINSATDTDVSKVPVQVTLAGDNAPTINGFMKSFDNKLDTKSGTIRARAVIENKDGKLIPGLFAKIRFGSTDKQKVTLITDRAVGTDQDKKFVLVVNAQNKIEYRPVVLGVNVEGLRVVESGLQEGEKIIVSGLFKYRPDMLVAPQEVPMNASEGMAQPIAEEGK
jgi:multidrug efflux system membrane fusion protein